MKNINSQIYVILPNIRSAYNVGSIFRTADAAGVDKIFLTGHSPIPHRSLGEGGYANKIPNEKVKKTALGAEDYVKWEYCKQTIPLIKKLKEDKVQIIALEQSPKSIDYRKFKPKFPIALIVGNEVKGLTKTILEQADKIIRLPMRGKKESLNVAVAFGIAIYKISEFRNIS